MILQRTTLKSLSLIIFAFMLCQSLSIQSVFAQQELVTHSPFVKNNSQYVVINPEKMPNAFEIELAVLKKDTAYSFQGDTLISFGKIWNEKFNDKQYFLKVPEMYLRSGKYKYFINSLDRGGNILTSTSVFEDHSGSLRVPGPPSYLTCSKECNGPDYAYKIDRYENDSINSSKYMLEMNKPVRYTDLGVEIKYYQYMGETQFDAWVDDEQNSGNYSWPQKVLNYPENDVLPGNENGENVTYFNSQNTPITDYPVYAIEKDMGPWEPVSSAGMDKISLPVFPRSDQSNWRLYPHNFGCDESTLHLETNAMNSNNELQNHLSSFNINEDIKCKQVGENGAYGVGGSSTGGATTTSNGDITYEAFVSCFFIQLSNGTGIWNWSDFSVFECNHAFEGGSTDTVDLVYSVNYRKVNADTSETGTTIFPSDFSDTSMAYLDSGLYTITLVLKDLTIVEFLTLKNRQKRKSSRKSDDFNAIVSPNPMSENYNVIMNADRNLGHIQYEVFTSQQNRIYNSTINGTFEEGVDKIKPVSLSPLSGNYAYIIHLFTFSDGSTYSLTTLTK